MSVLSVGQINKAYGAETILDGVTFQIHPGERVGLVGPNGAGKTTILKIISGRETADNGSVALMRGASFGYLEQSSTEVAPGTMEEELRRAFSLLAGMAEKIKGLEKIMASPAALDPAKLEAIMASYGELRHRYEEKGGYNAEARLRAVVSGLGFQQEDLGRPVHTFSGGERTRLRLARLLLEEPDILLLDEPTNHLDMAAVEWLEKFLGDWRGSVLLVSHDRYFLDRVAGRILFLEKGRVKSYTGNYSAFMAQRELERVTREKAYRKQQDYIEKETAYIRTLGTGEREKRQAKSREKRLFKVELIDKPRDEKAMSLGFGFSGRSGEIAVRLEGVAKSFGRRTVFSGAAFQIRWGDRIALVGPNGSGKSTLLKIITGELQPDAGTVWLGPSVRIVYFDQHQQALSPEKTPLDEIMDAGGMTLTEARTHLGRFLFFGDDVFKRNADLSGGEKSRLALAKLSLDEGNFLVLDEPTNHLDIRGVEEMESAISQFPGTLLVVSHDRYFVSRTTDKVLEVDHGDVTLYPISYEAYVAEREQRQAQKAEPGVREKRRRLEEEKLRREEELTRRRERRKLEQSVKDTEDSIGRTEAEITAIETELALPEIFNNFQLARDKAEQMDCLKGRLEELYLRWEELTQRLEAE